MNSRCTICTYCDWTSSRESRPPGRNQVVIPVSMAITASVAILLSCVSKSPVEHPARVPVSLWIRIWVLFVKEEVIVFVKRLFLVRWKRQHHVERDGAAKLLIDIPHTLIDFGFLIEVLGEAIVQRHLGDTEVGAYGGHSPQHDDQARAPASELTQAADEVIGVAHG